MENSRLNALIDKKIYVYGLGVNAKRICKSFLNNSICGLIALEDIGHHKYGFEIFSLEKALKDSEVIIIAASGSVTKIIFDRIKDTVTDRIPVYNMQGIRLNGIEVYQDNLYWNQTEDKLRLAIKQHDVISFDCFDTLIMRKCLEPSDVFMLMEKKLRDKGYEYPIAEWRKAAELRAIRTNPFSGLDDIYKELCSEQLISEEETDIIKQCELDLEYEITCPRSVMMEMLSFAVQNKKTVYVLSDMYLPGIFLERLLNKAGLENSVNILVSCEQGCSKADGNLYKKLQQKENGKSILHIGDNYETDCLSAENEGVDSFFIQSGKALFESSSISYISKKMAMDADRILMGILVTELFSNPFVLSSSRGKIQFKLIDILAKCCFSAVTMNYMSFIIKLVLGKENSKILFVSRDGYFLQKMYEKIRLENPKLDLPQSIYFYSSRTAATGVCNTREDIGVLLSDIEMFPSTTLKDLLEKRFHVSFAPSFDITISHAIEQWGYEQILSKILEYEQLISDTAQPKIENYKKYLFNQGIDCCDELYLVDLVTRGTVAYALKKLVSVPVHLIAMGGLGLPNAYCPDTSLFSLQYGNVGDLSELKDLFGFLELAYASSEGQLKEFDSAGRPLFVKNSEYDSSLVTEIQKTLLDTYEHLSRLVGDVCNLEFSYEYIVACMQMVYSQYSDIDDDIVDKFDFFDPLSKEKESNILKSKI